MWHEDYQFKTASMSVLSAFVGLGFIIFNGLLGLFYHSVWNACICVYYVLLVLVRAIVAAFLSRDIIKHNQKEPAEYRKIYIFTHCVMILMDLALIAPITYMLKGGHDYEFGLIPAIVMAAYTAYRITMGILHFKRSRKENNILIKELRTINLNDALVALITLQNALIIASGSEMKSMMSFTAWTSAAVWLAVFFITIKSFAGIRKV